MKLGQWLGLIAIVIAIYILWQIREILLLIFAAVVLATALDKLARRFQRSGMKRGFAVTLAVGIFLAVIVGFFLLIVPPFIAQFQVIALRVPQGLERLNIWLNQLETRIPTQLVPYVPDLNNLTQQAQPLINRVVGSSFTFVSGSLEVLLKILLVLVLTGMFLASPEAYHQLFVRLFPSFYRRRVNGILHECEDALGKWMGGAAIAVFVVGVMSMTGLSILRVPAALALGVLAGFMNLIPNLGPTISVIPAMAIALLDSPIKALLVLLLYFFIQQVESNFITPIVMAHQVSLLPAVTLIAQLFFVTFFGFLGLFLALPLTVVGKIWFREVILEDVLDRWDKHDCQETQVVFVSEATGSLKETETPEDKASQHQPDVDKAIQDEK